MQAKAEETVKSHFRALVLRSRLGKQNIKIENVQRITPNPNTHKPQLWPLVGCVSKKPRAGLWNYSWALAGAETEEAGKGVQGRAVRCSLPQGASLTEF